MTASQTLKPGAEFRTRVAVLVDAATGWDVKSLAASIVSPKSTGIGSSLLNRMKLSPKEGCQATGGVTASSPGKSNQPCALFARASNSRCQTFRPLGCLGLLFLAWQPMLMRSVAWRHAIFYSEASVTLPTSACSDWTAPLSSEMPSSARLNSVGYGCAEMKVKPQD